VSKKRAAYLASDDRKAGLAHMERVARLPCVVCGAWPVEVHHVTGDKMPRSDFRVIPLCYDCHRGADGYHNAKQSWVARYGHDYLLLDKVAELL
jgi:hypothetical protein